MTRRQTSQRTIAPRLAARGRRPQAMPGRRDASMAIADRAGLVRDLLAWYSRARRDLPWRGSRDPYRVWVSEIMLQQTQVERVRDYFLRFVADFPDVHSLAAAPEHAVLRRWEGLGYYRRARQLHAAARRIVADEGGEFPRTAADLRRLPGIGRYTAGAIASIAFDQREPIVEANSRRVIARLVAHAAPLDGPGGDEPIWRVAAGIVPARQPGRFNQALMDLGATVCTPDRPLCGSCPVARHCSARASGRVTEIPAAKRRRAVEEIRETAILIRRGQRLLVVRRGPGEWHEGLWDFPRLRCAARAAILACGARGAAAPAILAGLSCGSARRLGTLVHTVTHHRITLDIVGCEAAAAGPTTPGRRWVTAAGLADLAMTAPGRRIARLAGTRGLPAADKRPAADS